MVSIKFVRTQNIRDEGNTREREEANNTNQQESKKHYLSQLDIGPPSYKVSLLIYPVSKSYDIWKCCLYMCDNKLEGQKTEFITS